MAPWNRIYASLSIILAILSVPIVAESPKTEYVYGTDGHGVTRVLPVNRYPALYTGDFGDCLGGESLFNITKFDAAYYADNLTIAFHLDGTSNIRNESLMNGSSRFEMIFDPCNLNIYSLCPLNASVPVTGWAIIPVGPQQIGGIPQIAFSIPDFEGSTTLKIFANSSKTQIGCFQAIMRNGNSFSHPEAVAPVLAAFTLAAIIASFATAAYGLSVPHIRMHYAHSLSVFVVFETFQAIFFSGALSVDWPSVLVAWWSNFAWSTGMIYTPAMVKAIDSFAGVQGNASQVGGAGSVVINNGGGLITQIYGRSLAQKASTSIMKRNPYNASNPYDYTWAGEPVTPGMPTPGTWFGFWGTLSGVNIPGADALLVGLIWAMVAISLAALSVLVLKVLLECLARLKWIKKDRLPYFRSHWTGYLVLAMLRTIFASFFMVMTLSMFQFVNGGSVGTSAVTAVAFVVFLIVVTSLVARACRVRTRLGKFEVKPDQVIFHRGKLFNFIPGIIPAWDSTLREREITVEPVFTISLSRIRHVNHDEDAKSVHQDQDYVKRYGWLSAKYRRTRWWFFAYYVVYLFGRAAFIGAGVQSPLAQVYGLLIFEILAFAIIVLLNPFEGARNTALAVWMLSCSKIATTGLSIAFLPEFNIDRIIATVIGVVIIVIQGFLVVGLMILIVLSAISTWFSLTRNREEFEPEYLEGIRVRYFEKMETKAADKYHPPKGKKGKGKEVDEDDTTNPPTEPSFSVVSVRRAPKIEDEDEDDILPDLEPGLNGPLSTDPPLRGVVNRASRTNSVSSRYSVASLPRPPRVHQSSWSPRDFAPIEPTAEDRPDSGLAERVSSTPIGNGNGSGHGHDADERSGSPVLPPNVRPRSSTLSLQSPASPRPSSPFSPGHIGGRMTPSRETLARYAEERSSRYPTPTPQAIADVE
ncbi:hypothetical protein B0H66DRAFT_467301 [Apodospora peruviana]|uniref:ML-like domain-containing protein n=1 Tax=Apodospora peruviana TaxID=516989 RepID=A0AAE0MHE0_9PEZI|nr:hypothetical protein B0H66DRAFT_467301 [Apodospora peruviana]